MVTQKRKVPLFYVVLLSLILVGLLIAGIVLNLLWDFLYHYETYLPKYVARSVYEQYFLGPDFSQLYALGVAKIGPFDGSAQFEEYMRLLINGQTLEYYEMTTGQAESRRFTVCTKERKIADIYLKKTGEKAGWGQDIWGFDRLELPDPATRSVQVKVVHGTQLLLNGVAVSPSYVTESKIPTDSCLYMPEGVEGITYDVYTVGGLLVSPQITCQNKDGAQSQTYYDAAQECFVESIYYDTQLGQEYSQLAISALQTVQRYLTNDARLSQVRKYLDSDSEYYDALRRTSTTWYADHIAHEYADEITGEFYRHSPEVFSCRYVGTQIITRTKKDVRYFDIDCTLYFHLVDGEYKVYNIIYK